MWGSSWIFFLRKKKPADVNLKLTKLLKENIQMHCTVNFNSKLKNNLNFTWKVEEQNV